MTGSAVVPPGLADATRAWIAGDPHPGDRAELQGLLDRAVAGSAADLAGLRAAMQTPLTFGTAGIRGPLRAGAAGINAAVARRVAAGLGHHLAAQPGRGPVLVGYDARHRSAELAGQVAGVLAAQGFDVLLADAPVPTPLTATFCRRSGARAAVQITASHNPPGDNGIKVYLAGGAQLVPPEDGRIESLIAAAGPAARVDAGGAVRPWPAGVADAYLARVAALAPAPAGRSLSVVATPLHGVGGELLTRAFHAAGFDRFALVPAQARPDADFPTVAFPNPEEPGTCDLLLEFAARRGADLAVAVDPDADRCAIGVPDGDGRWRMLTGDETGVLLAERILRRLDRTAHPDPLVATTIVSSTLLRELARHHGVRYDETLTGFKWIVRAGDGAGTGLVFGYEEALGLCVDPEVVRDKDGISAAVVAADLADELRTSGRSLLDALDDLHRRHGVHLTSALSLRVDDAADIAARMALLRRIGSEGGDVTLAGEGPARVQDFSPRTDAISLCTGTSRVVVRPSGTEPKLKCYLEVVAPVAGGDLTAARRRAARTMSALRADVSGLLRF